MGMVHGRLAVQLLSTEVEFDTHQACSSGTLSKQKMLDFKPFLSLNYMFIRHNVILPG